MKKEIIIIIILIILVISLVLGLKFTTDNFGGGDANKFVYEDLKKKFPDADKIEILITEPKTNEKGFSYYFIKATVSANLSTPCPTKTYYYYNYPAQNFVPSPPDYVVKDCQICGNTTCMISFPEEAIIASHTLNGTDAVHKYVISQNIIPHVSKTANGWMVIWGNSPVNYSYKVIMGDNGTVLSIESNLICLGLNESQCRNQSSSCIPLGTSLKLFLKTGEELEEFIFEECKDRILGYVNCSEVVKMLPTYVGSKFSKECRCFEELFCKEKQQLENK